MTTLYETIRLLGCFTDDTELQNDTEPGDPDLYEVFHELFTGNMLEMTYVRSRRNISLLSLYCIIIVTYGLPTAKKLCNC